MTPLLSLTICWIGGAGLLLLDGRRRTVALTGALLLGVVLALDLWVLWGLAFGERAELEVVTGDWPAELGIRLHVDALGTLFAAVCAAVLTGVAAHEAVMGADARLFPALLLLLGAGLHGVFFTGDLFNLYVFFELAIVTSFALAVYGYERAELRGALVYITVNLFGTVLFLVSVANLYHAVGTLDLAELNRLPVSDHAALTLPASLMFVAFALKLGLFPFHGWVPVLYSHARPAVAAALAGALVNVGAYGLLRLGFTLFEEERDAATPVLLILGASAAIYGAVLGLRRRQPAEVAAYASVVHAGYLVLAIGIGGAYGATAVLLLVLSGSVDKAAMFLSLESSTRARRVSALVSGFSLAGLPVTLGFVAKVMLLRAALTAPQPALVTGAVVVASVLAMAMAVRLHHRIDTLAPPARPLSAPALTLVGVVVLLGLMPELTTALCGDITLVLLGDEAAEAQ